jgi:hypothetical protein
MSATALFELLAALAAFAAFAFLLDAHVQRPRPYKLLWSLGLLFYGIAAAAAFAGAASHWSVAEFKVWYFFGGTVTAVFLGLGSFYLLGPRRMAQILVAVVIVLALYVALRFLTDSVSNQLGTYIAAHSADTQAVTGKPALNLLPGDVRGIAIPLNILGGLLLFGAAAWSGWQFWRRHAPRYRVVSMLLLALGSVFPSILTGMQALGNSGGAALGEFLGAACLFAGLLISLDVFSVFRVPFTRIILRERRAVEAASAGR